MILLENIDQMIPAEVIPNIDDGAINSILGNVAAAARNHWVRLASGDSSSFRGDYILGIQPAVAESSRKHVVSLVGEVPHMLEDGSPRQDMRDTLLGPNVPVVPVGERGKHLSKNNQFYRSIPLRHTTPGKGGSPMGAAYGSHNAVEDSRKLGRAVYRAAKALAPTKTNPYGQKTQWGGRLSTSRLRGGLKAGTGGVPLLKPHHKSSIYEGMVRQEKTYEQATQSQYVTFRTISTGVRDDSWWRKPIEARHYAQEVSSFVAKTLPAAVQAYIQG